MYYCNDCAGVKGYPETNVKSFGPCEICGRLTDCNDMPSVQLPMPEREPIQSLNIINTEK